MRSHVGFLSYKKESAYVDSFSIYDKIYVTGVFKQLLNLEASQLRNAHLPFG